MFKARVYKVWFTFLKNWLGYLAIENGLHAREQEWKQGAQVAGGYLVLAIDK